MSNTLEMTIGDLSIKPLSECGKIHVSELDTSAIYFMMIYDKSDVQKLCEDQWMANETFLVLTDEDQEHEKDTVEFNILDTRYMLPREDLKGKSIAKLGMTDDFKRRFAEYKTCNPGSAALMVFPIPVSYLRDAELELKIFFREKGWLICPKREGVLLDLLDLNEISSFYANLSKKYMNASNIAETRLSQLNTAVAQLEDMLDSKEELVYNLLVDKQELLESKNETIQVLKEIKNKLSKEVKKRDGKIARLKADLASKETEFRNDNLLLDEEHINCNISFGDGKLARFDPKNDELNENLKYFGNLIINGEVHLACMYCGMGFDSEDELYDHERIC